MIPLQFIDTLLPSDRFKDTIFPGKSLETMICLHGFGENYQIAERVKAASNLEETLIGFNFPDHDIPRESYIPEITSFGSFRELLPALCILKKCVIDERLDQINLHGFSAGSGALINVLAALNTSSYDSDLKKIGISQEAKQKILSAIQKGTILLEVPLRSIDEIIEFRGWTRELEIIARNYTKNDLRPIDSLRHLEGLSLNILIYFEVPDEVLGNRDEALYIELLQKYNTRGTLSVLKGTSGGHSQPHPLLWQSYKKSVIFKEARAFF